MTDKTTETPTTPTETPPGSPVPTGEPVTTIYSGDPSAGVDPAGGVTLVSHDAAVAAPEAPTVVDTPLVYQTGSVLTCTMGNWNGVPVQYYYAWQGVDGPVGADQPNYTVTPAMVGYTVSCIVTARNAGGSGVAQSNEVVIVEYT